jgi:mannose-6-phosphate isomerase
MKPCAAASTLVRKNIRRRGARINAWPFGILAWTYHVVAAAVVPPNGASMNHIIRLTHNQPNGKFYRGGAKIRAFRGDASAGDRVPEDWVGSTTTLFAEDTVGLSMLPDGRMLRDAVTADPVRWLGADHVARYGADTMLLVKLLDAGERLPVHCHPSREFAHAHLQKQHGKAEAWCVLDGGQVRLGFHREVSREELVGWVATQDTEAMLAAMHLIDVLPGDSVFVPAGLPHALGEGVFVVEVQEPEDMSILLEWKGFQVDGPRDGNLGLGIDTVLDAVDRRGWQAEEIAGLVVRAGHRSGTLAAASSAFFRAERLTVTDRTELDAGFSVIIVLEGTGRLSCPDDELQVRAGDTVLVPFAAGDLVLNGRLTLIRCRPPAA